MKIRAKLTTANLALALTVALAASGLAHLVMSIERNFESLSEQTLRMTALIEDTKFSGSQLVASTHEFLLLQTLLDDPRYPGNADSALAPRNAELEQISKATDILLDRLAALELLVDAHFPDETPYFDALDESLVNLVNASRQMLVFRLGPESIPQLLEAKEAFKNAELRFVATTTAWRSHEAQEFSELKERFFYEIKLVLFAIAAGLGTIVFLVIGIGRAIGRQVAAPIENLSHAMATVARGDFSVAVAHNADDELGQLADDFNKMTDELRANIEKRMAADRALREVNERLEHEVALRTQEIEEAMDHLVTANQAKSEFLSSMSHELRTPLNAIMGFAQLLDLSKTEVLSAKQQKSVHQILENGNHLLTLINEVLDLSSIESGRLSVSLENLDIGDTIATCIQNTAPAQKSMGVKVINTIDSSALPMAHADKTRLTQAIYNLLTNAIKYNRTEDGTVTISCHELPDGYLRVRIADTGYGIPIEKQSDLFKPFMRLGHETGKIKGTGIGLTIVDRLMSLMHGRVGFTSDLGKGSVFWIDVPVGTNGTGVPPALPARPRLKPAPSADRAETRDEKVVLYIEDNLANMALMEAFIDEIDGVRLLSAHNAEEGLEIARDQLPDLVLMDINLPGMNGIEAAQRLKADERTAAITIIAVTAAAMTDQVRRNFTSDFKGYITKPFVLADFLNAVGDELGLMADC